MLRTWEVRWFFRSESAPDVRPAFAALEEADWRRDWYATPVNPACGIKLREGQLQPKLLVQDRGTQPLGSARGRVQQWEKWSLPLPEGDGLDESLLAATGWLAVDKRRALRFYRCERGGVEAVEGLDEAHCQLEWTQVRVSDENHWTLGLEVFDQASDGESVLVRVAERVLGEAAASGACTETRSLSYPAWLAGRTGAA